MPAPEPASPLTKNPRRYQVPGNFCIWAKLNEFVLYSRETCFMNRRLACKGRKKRGFEDDEFYFCLRSF